jgi:uncharacterized membrane protein YqjE
MDESDQLEWKGKFYKLAILLNAIILLAALSILALLLVPDPYRLPASIAALLLALLLAIRFRRDYRLAKAWLEEHAGKEKST